MRLYAWAYGLTPLEVATALEPFPRLGAVLNGSQYDATRLPTRWKNPWVAYVTSSAQAKKVAQLAAEGVHWSAVILHDERNTTGPSGHYLRPEEYRASVELILPHLPPGVPVSTMGLSPKSNFWQRTFWCCRYDDWYHKQLPELDLKAANPNKTRVRELERMLGLGVDILSPAVFRGWWYGLIQPIKMTRWVQYSRDPRVFAVCVWSLIEVDNQPHGLLTPERELTGLGRVVQRELRKGRSG